MSTITASDPPATRAPDDEVVEAIIISGPRRGEFISLPDGELADDNPALEAAMHQLADAMESLVSNVTAAADEAEQWRDELLADREG